MFDDDKDNRKMSLRRSGLPIALAALFIMLTRVPGGLLVDRWVIFNVDELEMTLSSLDRFLGVPSTSLAWPGGSLQMFAIPMILIEFLVDLRFPVTQDGFVTYLSHLYREPWHTVRLMRFLVIFVSSIGLLALYVPLLRFVQSRLVAVIAVAVMATIPTIWLHSHVATGDALAIGFACGSISILYMRERHWLVLLALSGTFLGLAVASKIPIVLLSPFVLAVVLTRSPRMVQAAAIFCTFLILGFVFANPYVWTDTIRFAKSILGNASRAGTPLGLVSSLVRMGTVASVPVALLSMLGLYELARRKQWLIMSGAVTSILLTLLVTSRTGVVYDRYFIPSVIPLVFMTSLGLITIATLLQAAPVANSKAFSNWILTAIGLLMCGGNAFAYRAQTRLAQEGARHTRDLLAQIKRLDCRGPIAVPKSLLYYVAGDASSRSLDRLSERTLILSPKSTVDDFATSRGISSAVVDVLGRSFTEDEQAFAARLNAIAYPHDRQGLDVIIWDLADGAKRFGLPRERDVESMFVNQEICALAWHEDARGLEHLEGRRFGDYRLLVNGS